MPNHKDDSSPQTEDGYTRIANELLDALCRIRIPGEARQLLDVVIRKTYGFNKKKDMISTVQIMEMTGMSRSAVQRARRKLLDLGVIGVSENGYTSPLTYWLVKNYGKWILYTKKYTVSNNALGCIPKRIGGVYQNVAQQKTITKDNIQKTLMSELFNSFWKEYPKKYGKTYARQKFNLKIGSSTKKFDELMEGLKHHKNLIWHDREKKHIPDPATFLNQERYKVDIEEIEEDWQSAPVKLPKYIPVVDNGNLPPGIIEAENIKRWTAYVKAYENIGKPVPSFPKPPKGA